MGEKPNTTTTKPEDLVARTGVSIDSYSITNSELQVGLIKYSVSSPEAMVIV